MTESEVESKKSIIEGCRLIKITFTRRSKTGLERKEDLYYKDSYLLLLRIFPYLLVLLVGCGKLACSPNCLSVSDFLP